MIIKYLILILLNLSIEFSLGQSIKRTDYHLQGENDEKLVYNFSSNYSFNPFGNVFDPMILDSIGTPYSGIVTKQLYSGEKTKDSNWSELDSICVFEGTMFGYSKKYPFGNMENAIMITFTNPLSYNPKSLDTPFNKYQIEASYNNHFKPRKLIFAKIVVYKENLEFSCHIDYSKKRIKSNTTIKRISDELGSKYSVRMEHKTKFKECDNLVKYFDLFPEILSKEILEICESMGVFSVFLAEDPIIKGNCRW